MALALGIIVALPTEASVLTRQSITQHLPVSLTKNVTLIVCGMGSANAEQAAQLHIKQGVTALLSFGTAGGINPECKAGDIIVADSGIDNDGHKISIDTNWQQKVFNTLKLAKSQKVISGPICESTLVVASSADKQKLFETSNALAVDMETVALARISQKHQIPFISLRVIVDPADMTIPFVVTNNMDENGNVSIIKLLVGLLKRPGNIFPLIQLAKNFSKARKAMVICKDVLGIEFLQV
ncbi:MAG: hypothetical protein ACC657_11370 [Thiohalomonadales bacterium]